MFISFYDRTQDHRLTFPCLFYSGTSQIICRRCGQAVLYEGVVLKLARIYIRRLSKYKRKPLGHKPLFRFGLSRRCNPKFYEDLTPRFRDQNSDCSRLQTSISRFCLLSCSASFLYGRCRKRHHNKSLLGISAPHPFFNYNITAHQDPRHSGAFFI